MIVELHGLTAKQHALCDIMWALKTQEGVDAFINTLPKAEAQECRSLIQLMIMSFADDCTDTTQAQSVLDQFRK